MTSWIDTTLGECFTLVRDKADPKTLPRSTNYVGMEHLTPGHPEISAMSTVDNVLSTVQVFEPGDVLYGKLRPYLRKVALADVRGVASTEILALRAQPHVDPRFLCLIAGSDRLMQRAMQVSAGSRMPRVSAADLRDFPIRLPPLVEQRQIADLVGAMDRLISSLAREEAATSALALCLAEELTSGIDQRPLDEVLDRIESGRSPLTSGQMPSLGECGVLKVSAVTPYRFVPEESKAVLPGTPLREDSLVLPHDVLITRANTPDRVGAVCQVPAGVRPGLYLCDKTLRLRVDPEHLDPRYLVVAMNLASARNHLTSSATGTSASMFNISQGKIRTTPIPLPALSTQRAIVDLVYSARSDQERLDAEAVRLRALRGTLIGDLLGRRVEISHDYDSVGGVA